MREDDLSVIESVFRQVDREVWIVTAAAGDRRGGLAATWVSQASIDRSRPVVLIGLAPGHFTAELVDASGEFAVHLLAPDQLACAWNFAAGSGRDRDKLAGLATRRGETASPLLVNCLAWLECRVFARLESGDRSYYWADVLAGGRSGSGPALRESDLVAGLGEDQLRELKADRDRDVAVQRPAHEKWRGNLPDGLRPGRVD